MQNTADASYENNGYTSEDFMKLSRTSPATSLVMNDRGLTTIIDTNKDFTGKILSSKTKYEFNRLRIWDQRSKSRKTTSLSKTSTMLHGMKTKLETSNNFVENAAYIYRKVVNSKLIRERIMNSLIAASLNVACRKNNMPRTSDDIVRSGNVERRILSQDLRTIIKKLELNLNQYDTTSFISIISNNMSLKEEN